MFDPVAPGCIIKERQFNQASYYCPSPSCIDELWNVQCLSASDQLWRVSSETAGAYLIASVTPACPYCGATLLTTTKPYAQQAANGLFQREQGEYSLNRN